MKQINCSEYGAKLSSLFARIKLRYRSIWMNRIGPAIRFLRKRHELTQEQLVARCNLIGWDISRGTLAKIESRTRRVTDEEVFWLSEALRVQVNDLFVIY